MMRTTGFSTKERVKVSDMIQAYCVNNIKRYDQMKNKLKSVKAQPVRQLMDFQKEIECLIKT